MDDSERLAVELDFWDDTVGAFEPLKVLRQLSRAFPEAEIDPTDHQRSRLLRELAGWEKGVQQRETHESLTRQSWGLYSRMGPTYRFIVPFQSGDRVNGQVRRLSVSFEVPPSLPAEYRDRLVAFLRSLRMGEPTFVSGEADS